MEQITGENKNNYEVDIKSLIEYESDDLSKNEKQLLLEATIKKSDDSSGMKKNVELEYGEIKYQKDKDGIVLTSVKSN